MKTKNKKGGRGFVLEIDEKPTLLDEYGDDKDEKNYRKHKLHLSSAIPFIENDEEPDIVYERRNDEDRYDSINHCHINGVKNKAFISRDRLFLIDVAASAKPVIQRQEEEIDLLKVSQESYTVLQSIHEQLINFQITEEIGHAALTLLDTKMTIDDAGIEAETWMIIESQEAKEVLDYQNGLVLQRIEDGQMVDEPKILPRLAQSYRRKQVYKMLPMYEGVSFKA